MSNTTEIEPESVDAVSASNAVLGAGPEFRFVEYNPRRAMRGADAVRVAVIENGEECWLWMSRTDIRKNIMIFGRHPELVKALEAYGT